MPNWIPEIFTATLLISVAPETRALGTLPRSLFAPLASLTHPRRVV